MKPRPLSTCLFAALLGSASYARAAEPVTVTFQNGLNSYAGTFDRKIGSGEVNGSSVTAQTTYYIDGGGTTFNDSGFAHGLLRFSDIETLIPAGAKIVNATLTVVQKTHSNAQSGDAFNVYRLTHAFSSTSSAASVTTDFGTNGIYGDVDWIAGSFSAVNVASSGVPITADVTRVVQSWVDGSPNHGLGIRSDSGINGWSFHTTGATAALRPKLQVTYFVEAATTVTEFQKGRNGYTDSNDIYLNGTAATNTVPGTTIVGSAVSEAWVDGLDPGTTDPDTSAMLRFGGVETALHGHKVESATLRIVTGFSSSAASSGGPFTVHRLLVPFSDTSRYGDFAGDAGAMLAAGQISPALATFADMANCEVADVDVSAAVRSWIDGAPNYGFYIGSGTNNGWQVFTTGAADVNFHPLLRVVSTPAPVAITNPINGSRLQLGTVLPVTAATAVLSPATASQVEFFVNGQSAGIDTSAPFTFDYSASKLGTFALTARLTDSNAVQDLSEAISLTVIPAAGSGGLYFDGATDHVALGDPAELKLSTFTLETWFRRETPGTAASTGGVTAIPLIAKGRNQADNSTLDTNWFLGIRESDGVLCADFEGAAGVNVPVTGSTPVPYGQWQHAAATFDGTAWHLYLNGNLERVINANGLTPRADSIQHASIATAMNSSGLGAGAFGGFMDEVRIWNVARSQTEIRQAINSEIVAATGLVARWGMSEGSGTALTNSASGTPLGAFSGAPVWTSGTTFSNNVKPSISFASPANGGNSLNTNSLEITVATNDPDGSISRVEYFDNGISIGTTTTAPFSFTYLNPPVGTRRISAVVTDSNGDTSRTDAVLTAYVTFASPTVPGYSAGIIDGADAELFNGTPAANPAVWGVVSSTASPLAFDNLGTVTGDLAVNVNGSPLAYNSGILLATNAVVNGNSAAIDNLVAPYDAAGFYHVGSMDNSGPGELEPTLSPESSSFSLGWFPYAQGWIGANIAADGSISASSSLPAGVTVTNSAVGSYLVSGLPTSGNLLALATGSGTDNCTAIAQSGDNWIVSVRDNNQSAENGDFALLYVPSTADRVLSGKIGNLGEFTPLNDDLAVLGVTAILSANGYELTFGDGSVVNPSNTALFISADANAGNGADNVYSYSVNGNSFVVFSHDLPGLNAELQNGGFRFLATPLNPVAPAADEVVLSITDASAAEDGTDHALAFTVTRYGDTADALTVNYTVGGSATPGSDFNALAGSVIIPVGSSSAQVAVTVLPDAVLEQMETVTLTLAAGSGYTASLNLTATGRISDALSTLPTTTVVFQQGLNGYTGQFQKRVGYALASGAYTAQLGSSVANYAVDGGDPDVNDLIRFDNIIGSGAGRIPSGARILKAELILTTAVASDGQSPGPYMVDRLTSPVDQDTTYAAISMGSGLEGVRGISTGLPVAGFPALAQGQAGAADVTAIVREWATGQTNHGFGILSGGTADGWNYDTVGNSTVSLRPKLVVTFISQPTREYTYTADKSARINSVAGSSSIDGATLDTEVIDTATNSTQEAFLRFPVVFDDVAPSAIPLDEEIIKAELLVTTASAFFSPSAQSSGPISIHQVLQDWNTSTSYGVYGPRIGTQVAESIATLSGLGQGSTTWVDVTSMVRNWRAGAANLGMNLKPGTGDDWMMFWPGTSYGEIVAPRLRITTAGGSIPNVIPFELWSTSLGVSGIASGSDDDQDGITALMEYALGLSPTASDVLPGIGTLGVSFTKGTLAAGDSRIAYRIMSSTDLNDWAKEDPFVDNSTVISFNVPRGGGKKFFRLEVVYTP